MATILKKGEGWQAQVFKQGVRKAATFATKTAAKAWATQTEAEILAGAVQAHSDKTLFDALERYATEVSPTKRGVRWETIRIAAFKRLPFAHYKLEHITTPVLAQWRDDRLKVVKSSTINREFNLMASILETARREWLWTKENAIRDVKRPANPKHRERIFTDSEVIAITEKLGDVGKSGIIANAFLFALETGMRRQEITGLSWAFVDIENRYVTLPKTKNGDKRDVPLTPKAIEILQNMQGLPKPFDVDPNVLTALFKKACRRCGIEDANFHDSRHTAITRLAKILSPYELARMVGHKSLSMTLVYYNESASEIAKKFS